MQSLMAAGLHTERLPFSHGGDESSTQSNINYSNISNNIVKHKVPVNKSEVGHETAPSKDPPPCPSAASKERGPAASQANKRHKNKMYTVNTVTPNVPARHRLMRNGRDLEDKYLSDDRSAVPFP